MKAVVLKSETSWPLAILWVCLSTIVAAVSLFCLTQPYWFVKVMDLQTPFIRSSTTENIKISAEPPNLQLTMEAVDGLVMEDNKEEDGSSSVGPVLYCKGTVCKLWTTTHLSTILFGGGGAILALTCVSAAVILFVQDKIWRHKAINWIGYLQVAAG